MLCLISIVVVLMIAGGSRVTLFPDPSPKFEQSFGPGPCMQVFMLQQIARLASRVPKDVRARFLPGWMHWCDMMHRHRAEQHYKFRAVSTEP